MTRRQASIHEFHSSVIASQGLRPEPYCQDTTGNSHCPHRASASIAIVPSSDRPETLRHGHRRVRRRLLGLHRSCLRFAGLQSVQYLELQLGFADADEEAGPKCEGEACC